MSLYRLFHDSSRVDFLYPHSSNREAKDVNCKAQNGWTALTLAVFHGRQDCVEALIKILGLFTTSSFLVIEFLFVSCCMRF